MNNRGLAPGNHVIERSDEEIAASVNVSLPKLVGLLEERRRADASELNAFRQMFNAKHQAIGEAMSNRMVVR